MKKELSEMVWSVENYTDKIHTGVKATMANYSHLSFTLHQLRPYLQAGYPWLKNLTERQATLLDQIIKTGLAKLIQMGTVKKVTSKVSVEPQWQWASKVAESGYTNITSEDDVAQTDEAKKAVKRRAVGGRLLWKLNSTPLDFVKISNKLKTVMTNFTLPKTSMCVVVWYRDGKKNETLIPTPRTNSDLRNDMLMQHRVGFSEIRAVKSVDGASLTNQINFGNIAHRRMKI